MKSFSIFAIIALISAQLFSQSFEGESVTYDPGQNRFFTSSDSFSIIQRNSAGELSYFGTNLVASYGMEVMNGVLFAVHGSSVYGYDLDTETEVTVAFVPGAGFLNGLASDPATNRVWVSDFSNDEIIEIDFSDFSSPTVLTVIEDTGATPNGVWFDDQNNRLLFTTWTSNNAEIKSVDLANAYALSTAQVTSVGRIDGLDENNQGELFISSWSPVRISKYSPDLSTVETITAPGISNPADIEYALEIDTLAIPNGNGEVSFIGFNVLGLAESIGEGEIEVFPSPASTTSLISFELQSQKTLDISLLDANGQFVRTISQASYPQGLNRVVLDVQNLSSGLYHVKIEHAELLSIQRLVVIH